MKLLTISITLFLTSLLLACDSKKTSIAGTVVEKTTGVGVDGVLVSYVECKENGDNCTEMIIGQTYTNQSGEFIIDQKRAGKSKTKWVTAHKNNKKLAQVNDIGLTDKNIKIEVAP